MIPEYLSPLANHLWQSTLIIAVASILAALLRNNSARVRYWLWFIAVVKFLIPFSLLLNLGQRLEWQTPPAITQLPVSTVAQISIPFDVRPIVHVQPTTVPKVNPIPLVLFSVWLAGFTLSAWLWLNSWLRIRAAVKSATPAIVELPGGISIRVVSSPALVEPSVFGVLRPVLLLPDGITERLTPDQLRGVLLHELCHVRRHDNLAMAIYMTVETVFWFYPLVRWVGRRLVDERERACDEDVLVRLGNGSLVYAEGILGVCKHYLESPPRCAAGVMGSDLKKRVRAILTGHVADLTFVKKALLAVAGMWALAIPLIIGMVDASHAVQSNQDISGTWQGILSPPGGQLRVVVKITKAADGKFEGQMISIDQGAQPRSLNLISLDGRTVKLKLDALGASFEGTVTADGNGVNGTFAQGPNSMPLNLNRATPQTAWAIPEPPPAIKPMDPAADPGIEVATVKPSPPDARGRGIGVQGVQLRVSNYTVLDAITFAYDLHQRQVSGGPSWMSSDRFEIVIKPDTPGQPNAQQVRRLIQKVLTDRFQLKFHGEKRELSVYAITLPANTKHKLTESGPGENLPNLRFPRPGLLPARNATMDGLAQALQRSVLDRPVINQTEIQGKYDFTLDWMPDQFQFATAVPAQQLPDNGKPNIYQAFQEQLGLKLEATKAGAEVFIIDKVERPSEN